ncbi:MAG: zinc dependent phospholipase C family protein [Planctomycetota bacterium]
MSGLFALSALLALAALALAAPAWGPGTHIQLTRLVLGRLRSRRGLNSAQALVLEHPQAFLYGNVAADLINFKGYGGFRNHCHNWSIQERLEEVAEDEGARAFILGYLCHLAADVVAHNHFVPYHLVANFPPKILGHLYWEALADAQVTEEEWHAVDGIKRSRQFHVFDSMVHRAVRRKVLSLRSNRWIFNNILLGSSRRRWRELVQSVRDGERKHRLDPTFHEACRQASLRLALSVFHPRRLALLKVFDPRGKGALQGAARLRRELLRDFGVRSRARDVASALAHAAYSRLPWALSSRPDRRYDPRHEKQP